MRRSLFILCLLFSVFLQAQPLAKPKLVVGIVVDQMRWDYLYRFYNRYGAGGFKRMLTQGFSCENTIIPYLPTHTAAGHTCIYTGSVPALHGILGNAWYDKTTRKNVYCTDDSTVTSVGTTAAAGKMSPRNMWATTVGDELRVATNFRSKTISIALKDRGSILPGGHTANAAYWFDNTSGGWITSTHYMQALPAWMAALNDRKLPDAFMKKDWNTLYPLATYTQSTDDDKAYENIFPGEGNRFPHRVDTITRSRMEAFRTTPWANTYTVETAKTAVEAEHLGGRGETDFLAISFSSPDYVGHTFGPNSVEIEDTYLRLDKDLAALFSFLDTKLGSNQYVAFLTADHAVEANTTFLKEARIPAGTAANYQKAVNDALQKEFEQPGLVLAFSDYQVFLNHELMTEKKLDKAAVKRTVMATLLKQRGIANVVDLENVASATLPEPVKKALVNGYNQKMSGDIQYVYQPQYGGYEKGATHGVWNPYDSHIPLVWYGWGIKKGKLNRETYMTDIAPTVAAMLQIQMPSASIGKVIEEVMK